MHAKPDAIDTIPHRLTQSPEHVPEAVRTLYYGGGAEQWNQVRSLAFRHLDRFISLEPKVLRGDDPDAIHDIRVASRRVQQALDFLFPSPSHSLRRPRRRIRRCRSVLSDVRNCDVFLERVDRHLARKRASRRDTWEAIRKYLLTRRAGEHARALRKLGKLNLAWVYLSLKEHVQPEASRNADDATVPGNVDESLPQLAERVREALQPIWQDFETRLAESQRDAEGQTMHRARIAAKKLRYLVEVICEFDVKGGREALSWLRKLQKDVGSWHDLEVMDQMLAEMIAKPGFLRRYPDVATEVMKIISGDRSAKKRYQNRYLSSIAPGADEGYTHLREWSGYLLESSSTPLATA